MGSMGAATAVARDVQTVDGDPMKTRIYTLDNGLKVYISQNNEKPRITAHIAVNTGSRNDPAETTGLAHYLEHLMFKGSQRFGTTDYEAEKPYLDKISALYEEYRVLTDAEQRKAKYREIDSLSQIAAQFFIPNEYDKMMATIGSEGTNAYTSNDQTVYVEDIPSNELERWCIVQSDRFQNMVMRGFHTELEAVYEEKNISMAKDSWKCQEAMLRMLFPNHPYGTQSTIGTQEHLKNPSQVNIRNYFNKYYVPNNIAICLAGDIDADAAIAMIERYFGAWKPGSDITPPHYGELTPLTQPRDTTVLGQETETVIMAWRMKKAASLQNDTLTMVDYLLSNGDVGLIDIDLNQKMRVLGGGSFVWALKDHSLFALEGTPNEGQSLDEVRQLLMEEIEKVKRGEWDEQLLQSIVRNERLAELRSLDNNRARVSKMVDSYINGVEWQQQVEKMNRLSRLTKADIVQWANEHLGNAYICVYKRKGEDTTLVKIDKPAITPISSNRDLKSTMMADFERREVPEIQPQFVDFKKELTFSTTRKGLPVIYKHNADDERFSLTYHYDFGSEADKRYPVAADLSDLFGTKKLSVETIKRRFYDLACSYSISVSTKELNVSISGLQENMPEAVRLLDDVMHNMCPDTAVYSQYVGQVMKSRMEIRTNQGACNRALQAYGIYGKRNYCTDVMTPAELTATQPQVYTDLIKALSDLKHEVLYWGPASMDELKAIVDKDHRTHKTLTDGPKNVPYTYWPVTETQILMAPYDAKNIYMGMYILENKPFDVDRVPYIQMFNEYFGGSMNAVVFQELREARGLAYSAWATYNTPSRKEDKETYMQHIISQNDKMMDCISVFNEITDTIPQSEAAFSTAKSSLMKSLAAARTTKSAVIWRYLALRNLGLDYDIRSKVWNTLPHLTLQDIVRFEQENIRQKPMRYTILGNQSELDMEALRQLGPVTELSLDDIFAPYK